MAENNIGSAWSCMKTIAGTQKHSNSSHVFPEGFGSDAELANAFNSFYTRFEV